MFRNLIFSSLIGFIFSTQTLGSEKQFEISQVPVIFLNKVYKHLQVMKHEEYDVLSIHNRGFPEKPNFWVQLRNSSTSAFHGFIIDHCHNLQFLSEVESMYNAPESKDQKNKTK